MANIGSDEVPTGRATPAPPDHGAEAIIAAVGFAASEFLRAPSWEASIPEVLARLGQAAHVSRVYLFENHRDEFGRLLTSQRFEWTAPDVKPQIDNPDLQELPWDGAFRRWVGILPRGGVVHGSSDRYAAYPASNPSSPGGSCHASSRVSARLFAGSGSVTR